MYEFIKITVTLINIMTVLNSYELKLTYISSTIHQITIVVINLHKRPSTDYTLDGQRERSDATYIT